MSLSRLDEMISEQQNRGCRSSRGVEILVSVSERTCIEDSVSSFLPADHLHHLPQHSILHQGKDWSHLICVPEENHIFTTLFTYTLHIKYSLLYSAMSCATHRLGLRASTMKLATME